MSDAHESSMVKSAQSTTENPISDQFILEREQMRRKDSVAEGRSCDRGDLGPMALVSGATETGDNKSFSERDNLKTCSCPCHSNSSDCVFSEKLSESIRFRELLILHLDMIEEQNAMLQVKEKHIHNLKIENEQLNARLNRMERRVAVKARKLTEDADTDPSKGKSLLNKRSHSISGLETSDRFKKAALCGSFSLNVTSKQFKDNGTGLFLSTDIDYLQSAPYSSLKAKTKSKEESRIAVPTWKDVPIEHIPKSQRSKNTEKNCAEAAEEVTDDDSYQRRHLKMELDEIRRKRWDIQQMRQERIHENLRQKQREREDPGQATQKGKPSNSSTQSLHPPPGNAMFIEVANEIPVFALGSRIPHLEPSEFDLPWFDMAKREIQNRQKKSKSTRGQRRKTWYKF